MAEDDQKDDDDQQINQGGGKKRLVLMIILCLVIAGVSVGGTLVALKIFSPQPPTTEAAVDNNQEEPTPPPTPAIYYPIKPEIIVTYEARGRQRYMQAEITLMVRDEDVIASLELHMPMVRNALNMIMGSQSYEDVQTAAGKELMRQQCLIELQGIMEKENGKPGIEQVLFTNLVLQ